MYLRVFKRGLIIILYIILIANLYFLYLSLSTLKDNLILLIIICLIQLYIVIGFLWILNFGIFSHKFYIDYIGVKYYKRGKIYTLKWKDIKSIGLVRNYYNGSINKNSFIYFDGRDTNENIYNFEQLNIKQYNDYYFGVQYRKKIVDEIVKYWGKPIQGLYQVEGKNR